MWTHKKHGNSNIYTRVSLIQHGQSIIDKYVLQYKISMAGNIWVHNNLQSGIPPKSQKLGSDPESGRIYTPAHVAFQAILSTPCVSTVKEFTTKSIIASYSQLWSLYKKWYISSKCLISQSAVDGMLSYKSIQRTNLESVRWLLSPKWLLTLQYTTQ